MKLFIATILFFRSLILFGQQESNKFFESSKGMWPAPLTKYIKIEDNEERKRYSNMFDSTLRIDTDSAYNVSAVHEGTIVNIIQVGKEYTVVTKFAGYFITYSRLAKPGLIKGKKIKAKQILSKLIKDDSEKNYTLEIILTKGDTELSAKKWIKW